MKFRFAFIFVLLVILVLLFFSAPAMALTTEEVAKEFMIRNCPYKQALDKCPLVQAGEFKEVIKERIDQGWSKQQIVQYLNKTYGKELQAAPRSNAAIWVVIVAAGAIGVAGVYFSVRRKKGEEQKLVSAKDSISEKLEEQELEKLKEKLDKLEY